MPDGGFASNIPPHLLDGADDQTRWLMNEMSKNSQGIEWTCHGLLDTNRQVRRTNGRLLKAEAEITDLSSKMESLETQAKAMTPFFKPLSQFAALWEYRVFRWVFYIAIFFFFTYLLPYYLQHPMSITDLGKLIFGQ